VASLQTPRSEGELLPSPTLKAFTFNELKTATRNFKPNSMIGEGGFGRVYKGFLTSLNQVLFNLSKLLCKCVKFGEKLLIFV